MISASPELQAQSVTGLRLEALSVTLIVFVAAVLLDDVSGSHAGRP